MKHCWERIVDPDLVESETFCQGRILIWKNCSGSENKSYLFDMKICTGITLVNLYST
jgi:hypothetical protein